MSKHIKPENAPKKGNDTHKKLEEEVDESSEDSFPASDAPSWVNEDVAPKKPVKPA